MLVKTKIPCLIPSSIALFEPDYQKWRLVLSFQTKLQFLPPLRTMSIAPLTFNSFFILLIISIRALFIFTIFYIHFGSYLFASPFSWTLCLLLQLVLNCVYMRYTYPNIEGICNGSFCELLPFALKMGHFSLRFFFKPIAQSITLSMVSIL